MPLNVSYPEIVEQSHRSPLRKLLMAWSAAIVVLVISFLIFTQMFGADRILQISFSGIDYSPDRSVIYEDFAGAMFVGGYWGAEVGVILGMLAGTVAALIFLSFTAGCASLVGLVAATPFAAWGVPLAKDGMLVIDVLSELIWLAQSWIQVIIAVMGSVIALIAIRAREIPKKRLSFREIIDIVGDQSASLSLFFTSVFVFSVARFMSGGTEFVRIFLLLAGSVIVILAFLFLFYRAQALAYSVVGFVRGVEPYVKAVIPSFIGFFSLLFVFTTVYALVYSALWSLNFLDIQAVGEGAAIEVARYPGFSVFLSFWYDSFRIMSLFNDPTFIIKSGVVKAVMTTQISLGIVFLILLLAIMVRSLEHEFRKIEQGRG